MFNEDDTFIPRNEGSWLGLMHSITEKDRRDVNKAFDRFWQKNQIIANVGTRTHPVFIRSNKPRIRKDAGSILQF